MGYRDDTTALQSQLEILERENSALVQELEALATQEEELRRTIRRKKLRIRLHRAGKWIVGHPKITAVLLIILTVASYVLIQGYLERRAHRQRLEQRLGGCLNPSVLKVRSSHYARVYVSGLQIGKTPQEISVCPGRYRVQVLHRKALPWQQVVSVERGQERQLNVNLVPWRPRDRPRDGVLFFSRPEGALLFVNGREVGRTPVFVRQPDLVGADRLTLALAAPGFRPHTWNVRKTDPGKPIWLHMNRPRERRQQRRRQPRQPRTRGRRP